MGELERGPREPRGIFFYMTFLTAKPNTTVIHIPKKNRGIRRSTLVRAVALTLSCLGKKKQVRERHTLLPLPYPCRIPGRVSVGKRV